MNFFDAICHAMATLSTGGFSTKQASLGAFGAYSQYIVIIFMFLAGINFSLTYFALRGKPLKLWKNEEFRVYLFAVLIISRQDSVFGPHHFSMTHFLLPFSLEHPFAVVRHHTRLKNGSPCTFLIFNVLWSLRPPMQATPLYLSLSACWKFSFHICFSSCNNKKKKTFSLLLPLSSMIDRF